MTIGEQFSTVPCPKFMSGQIPNNLAYIPKPAPHDYQITLETCRKSVAYPQFLDTSVIYARKGDVLGFYNSAHPWLYVAEDLPGFIPSSTSWLFRPRAKATMPAWLLVQYAARWRNTWLSGNGIALPRVNAQVVGPWIPGDVARTPEILKHTQGLILLHAEAGKKLEQLQQAFAYRMVEGKPIATAQTVEQIPE